MEEDNMPDTVPELQALVLSLRAQLADARRDLSQQRTTPPTTTSAPAPSTTAPQRITSSSGAKKTTMSSLFGRKKATGTNSTPSPTTDSSPPPTPSAPQIKSKDADSRRLAELQRVLDEDDIAELRRPMEHPLAAAARRKHLMLNTGAGTVSSLGFGGVTAPKVYPTGGAIGERGVSEEEEVLSLVKQVVEDVSVESRREKLENDDDEFLEAKLRRLQGKK